VNKDVRKNAIVPKPASKTCATVGLIQAISGLSGTTGMADEVKAHNMGLL
jgi:hypothetical protein